MGRTLLGILCGLFVGVACAAGLLAGTNAVLAWLTAPTRFAIEHGVVYLGVILGAGFGAVAGGMVGVAGCREGKSAESPR
jgi:hypothetical protein